MVEKQTLYFNDELKQVLFVSKFAFRESSFHILEILEMKTKCKWLIKPYQLVLNSSQNLHQSESMNWFLFEVV